jgi:hypothetical protein
MIYIHLDGFVKTFKTNSKGLKIIKNNSAKGVKTNRNFSFSLEALLPNTTNWLMYRKAKKATGNTQWTGRKNSQTIVA